MDEEFANLESELKALRPRELSSDLQRRLASAMPAARSSRRLPRWTWLAFPAVAALAFAVFVGQRSGESSAPAAEPASPATFKPVAAENLLLETRDEGYVTLTNGTPARRTREMYLDTITWRDPRSNASLTWSVPREEVSVVPVAFQ